MKREQREPYLYLVRLADYVLCSFCKYAEWDGVSCCDASLECTHPIEEISDNVYGWEDRDCWGFRPSRTFQDIGMHVGIHLEGNMPHWSATYKQLIAIIPSKRDREEMGL